MTRFQVDSDAMSAATTAVQASAGRIQAEVSGLHSQLVNLQSTWTGQAAGAFQAAAAEWRATQQRVEEVLASINAALLHAAQEYADIEFRNLRLFAR